MPSPSFSDTMVSYANTLTGTIGDGVSKVSNLLGWPSRGDSYQNTAGLPSMPMSNSQLGPSLVKQQSAIVTGAGNSTDLASCTINAASNHIVWDPSVSTAGVGRQARPVPRRLGTLALSREPETPRRQSVQTSRLPTLVRRSQIPRRVDNRGAPPSILQQEDDSPSERSSHHSSDDDSTGSKHMPMRLGASAEQKQISYLTRQLSELRRAQAQAQRHRDKTIVQWEESANGDILVTQQDGRVPIRDLSYRIEKRRVQR